MPDEKQNGLLRDRLDSAEAIQRYLGGVDYDLKGTRFEKAQPTRLEKGWGTGRSVNWSNVPGFIARNRIVRFP